ncbi:putative membrane protein [Caulobacter ginsengisoli]|uniref:Membrane protein n=1 Tax=Caulobacter ginsengisoli TaxID=400775 RepID=A0ABU0IKN5_9CAUL|nr:DUF2177 family protein [Caulobacter ginsengisoli]MDQ0462573.1 putative membrane protein [Caulobacter ginsengisoli]
MRRYLIAYAVAAVVFLALDMTWLGVIAHELYRDEIGPLILETPRLGPAAAFYLIYLAGVVIFAIRPALASGRLAEAALMGTVFGFIAYATYDLTNLATLKGFSLTVTFADLAWGAFVSAAAAGAGYLAAKRWG